MNHNLNDPMSFYDDPFGDDLSSIPLSNYAEDVSRSNAESSDGSQDLSEEALAEAYAQRELERSNNRQALYDRLNKEQHEAVFMPSNSCLVLAAAGSGKTSVLTARVARLISDCVPSFPASSVMAVTFTNKASQEMRHRLRSLLNRSAVKELWVGTFHSLCNRILRENYEAAGLPKAFAILDTDGQESLVRNILKDFGLTKSAVKEAKKLAALVSTDLLAATDPLAKHGADEDGDEEVHEFMTPAQCVKRINAKKERGEGPAPSMEALTARSSDIQQVEGVYAEYEARLQKQGLLDFQDLLRRAVELLRADKEVRGKYQEKYRAILVDEFQDTNDIQYEWISLMKGPHCHVTAVGDDDQSIYAFRGADPKNMGKFLREMASTPENPSGRLIRLEQNYRSLPHILEAANSIIERNTNRLGKVLRTSKQDGGEKLDLVTFKNGFQEAAAIASGVYRLVKEQKVLPSEIAILYRTNMQSRLIEQELNKLGIPLTVYGGFRFYERKEIKNVMAYLDLVGDISRDLSFVRVANFPPRGIGEGTLEELRQSAQSDRLSMIELVEKRAQQMEELPSSIGNLAAQKKLRQLHNFMTLILDLADAAVEIPLSKLIELLVEKAGIAQYYIDEASGSKSSQEEAKERLDNIAELVSAAKQFELEHPELATAAEQLPEYLSFVALMTSTSESDMNRKNTVSLMTVHSSKGLEFDHVYISGLEEGVFPHNRAINEDEERGNGRSIEEASRMVYVGGLPQDEYQGDQDGPAIQEERRLMYVALTRARKTLVLSHAEERMTNGDSKSAEPSRFLSELPDRRLNRIDDQEVARAPFSASKSPSQGIGENSSMAAAQMADVAPLRAKHSYGFDCRRLVAVIGTAGRDKHHPMDKALWDAMLADSRRRVQPGDALVSGGAAWADHVAVRLYLEGAVKNLALHLPAPLVDGQFAGPDRDSAGSAANYYHGLFLRTAGVDGLKEIEQAIAKGAYCTYEPAAPGYRAMFHRNSKVAEFVDSVTAYTFNPGDVPEDGGTKDTWDQIQGEKIHVCLKGLTGSPGPAAAAAVSPAGKLPQASVAMSPKTPSLQARKPWERNWKAPATEPKGPAGPVEPIPPGPGVRDTSQSTGPSPSVMTRLQLLGKTSRSDSRGAAASASGPDGRGGFEDSLDSRRSARPR